jgi:enoyl-CoA hydratase/carnithine racemase
MISVRSSDGVAVVRLEHGKVNALDLEVCQAISETFRGVDAPAVVLTGAGPAFSAGVDLWRVLDGGAAYVSAFIPALVDAFAAVFTCERPVVAAINGHAIAGGCVIAAACDHRIMGAGRIGIPEMLVGVPFPATALAIVEHAFGPVRARRLVYTGELLSAEAALAQGLVDEAAGPEALLDRAIAHATGLAESIPPTTFAATKRHLNPLPGPSPYDGEVLRLWQERVADGWIAAYMQRTVRRSST